MRPGVALAGLLSPLAYPAGMRAIAERGVTAFSLDQIPRITRAQGMDALSSQATVSGYKAVLLAAAALPRFFPMLMTAAGTVRPAKVLVLGAGVAGPAGDRDRRAASAPSCRRSTPAPWCASRSRASARASSRSTSRTARARAATPRSSPRRRTGRSRSSSRAHVAESDVVITTALVPGPPRAGADHRGRGRRRCAPGSVIVDLAAETGGNCELTQPGPRGARATA